MKWRLGLILTAVVAFVGVLTWAGVSNNHAADSAAVQAQIAQVEAHTARQIASHVHRAQIETCKQIGAPLRHSAIALWHDKIESAQGLRPSDFPGFDPQEFQQRVRKQRRAARMHIHNLRAAPTCRERF